MTTETRISLLIANYNNGQYLEECIQSILNQTSDRWDIYIVDDASTDNSSTIYDQYKDNPSIKIFFNEKNLGYIKTLEKLIELSENEIVGILDPDDKLDISCVEKIMNYYDKHYYAGFVYTNFWFCDQYMKINNAGFCKPIPKNKTNLDLNCVSHFKTFKRSIYYKTSGYDEKIKYAEDKDLIFKIEEITHLHFINEPLYFYRILPESQGHGRKAKEGYKNFQKARKFAYYRRLIKDWNGKESLLNDLKIFSLKRQKQKYKMNHDVALENLINARDILNDLNIRYWLTDGTLLGYYREKNFIGHDYDIDFGSMIKDYDDRIIMEFIRNGWKCEFIYGSQESGLELCFKRNHVRLDIFFFYPENLRFWHGAWKKTKRGYNLIKYYYDKLELTQGKFLGHEFIIPKDPENYIRTKYGENWRTPNSKWDWAFDPENSVKTDIYKP